MHALLKKLQGGDRRSIGRSGEVVADVLKDGALFEILITALRADDTVLRMRGADAVEKVSLRHPEYLQPHKDFLIGLAATSQEKEVRWHMAQILPRLSLRTAERRRAVELLLSYCNDGSSIVKTFAMQALADFARQSPALRPAILLHLRELTATGTPAMKARGRKLLAVLEGAG